MDINHKRSAAMICYCQYPSPIGPLTLYSDGFSLTGLIPGEPESCELILMG